MVKPNSSRISIKTTVFSISAVASLMNIPMGNVSVLFAIEPATVIVAPNSPIAFAHVRMPAAIIPFLLRGSVIVVNAFNGETPNEHATLSYRCGISSMEVLMSLVAMPRVVINWARTIPLKVNTNWVMLFWIHSPKGLLKKISSIAPRAAGETTIGSSSIVSMNIFPLKSYLDNAYADGIARKIESIVEIVAAAILIFIEKIVLSDERVSQKRDPLKK